MVVYYEYVLIDNFLIDFLLLKTTFNIVGKKCKIYRLIFCSIIGAICSLAFPLISIKALLTVLKVACGLFLVVISNSYSSKREYIITTFIFFALTFLSGGIVIGVYSMFNIDYSTEISIAIMFLPVYIVINGVKSLIKYIYRRKDVMNKIFEVQLVFGNIKMQVNGFLDTGNGVFYKDYPVIFCPRRLAKKFFDGDKIPKLDRISVRTVNSTSKNVGFLLDSFLISINDNIIEKSGVMLCVTNDIEFIGYDVILNPILIEGELNEKTIKNSATKVC